MATCIVVDEFVAEKLQQFLVSGKEKDAAVILLGQCFGNDVQITSFANSNSLLKQDEINGVKYLLPGGVNVCGIACGVSSGEEISYVNKYHSLLDEVTSCDPVILFHIKDETGVHLSPRGLTLHNGELKDTQVKITSEKSLNKSLIARVQSHVPLTFNLGVKDSWKSSLHCEIERLCEEIVSDSTLFHLHSSQVLLGSTGCYGLPSNTKCQDVASFVVDQDDTSSRKKKKIVRNLSFDVYTDLSGTSALERAPSCSPIINYNTETVKKVSLSLPVDVVCIFHPDTLASGMASVLCQCISQQLLAMETCLCQYSKNGTFFTPVPYHFQPLGIQSLFTVIYPHGITDDQLVKHRQSIHRTLCLPEDRPLFRRANIFVFPNEQGTSRGYLVNVHEGVAPSKVHGGSQYLTQGQYTYHHYMQDRFDDNKWGCAYRSLQTLVSWFLLQGYTDKDVPGHKDIQQILVDIGDKDPKFVGSRQWIGSMEVSFVLDTYIGVTCKILNVSSGADLSGKGRELASHFSTQGTPVMIGGGVLAHTILGVDYNEVTGDINFLILDPHYTGSEDIKTILDKGWCGWKGPDFWDTNAHYNMCMPQRPAVI